MSRLRQGIWLLNCVLVQTGLFRPGETTDILSNPESLSADPVMLGFTLELSSILDDESGI